MVLDITVLILRMLFYIGGGRVNINTVDVRNQPVISAESYGKQIYIGHFLNVNNNFIGYQSGQQGQEVP